MATFIIGGIIFALVVLAGIHVYKQQKSGSCCGGCSGCSESSACHCDDKK